MRLFYKGIINGIYFITGFFMIELTFNIPGIHDIQIILTLPLLFQIRSMISSIIAIILLILLSYYLVINFNNFRYNRTHSLFNPFR